MAPPPFLTSKEPFREILLEVKNEENVASISYLEQLHFHFSLSCNGEGNGSPLQCSCLEKPRDGGAWWEAICGVAQSRTRLRRLSSSSGSPSNIPFSALPCFIFPQVTHRWASLVAQLVKNLSAMRETWVRSLGWEYSLEKGRATHSSVLAWRIPWTVQSIGSQRV